MSKMETLQQDSAGETGQGRKIATILEANDTERLGLLVSP